MKAIESTFLDLKLIQKLVYDKCGFELNNLKQNIESEEYGACTFELNQKKIQYRVSKITPTKIGQFVTIWKRNNDGITEPFDFSDDLDFIIITAKQEGNIGQFIFPKLLLIEKGIITSESKKVGKRGIRVYPSWDTPQNNQAKKTQFWQLNYFFKINETEAVDYEKLKKILNSN